MGPLSHALVFLLLVWGAPALRPMPVGRQSRHPPQPSSEDLAQGPAAGGRPLSLAEAERRALERSPDLRSSAAAFEAAEADRKAQRGLLLPRLHADANLQYWGAPYQTSFAPASLAQSLPPPFASFVQPITVRNSWTSTTTILVQQPLTQLWGLWRHYQAQADASAAATAHLGAAGRELVAQVREGYFRLLQAQGNASIAEESVRELASHVAVAKEQLAAGTLVRADLLRAEVQLGQARQDLVRAHALRAQARATLDALLGEPADAEIAPLDPFVDRPLPAPQGTLAELTERALASRPDLEELALKRRQASREVQTAWSQLVPAISLVGEYQHTTGQLFFPADQAFVGGTLAWDIWDWGNKYYGVQGARARVAEGDEALRAAAIKLRTDVERTREDLLADHDALGVATEVVEQAEESFRLETERYKAQTATSTDLLDAQAALSQAKFRLTNARYDYLIALAELEKLVGDPLVDR